MCPLPTQVCGRVAIQGGWAVPPYPSSPAHKLNLELVGILPAEHWLGFVAHVPLHASGH